MLTQHCVYIATISSVAQILFNCPTVSIKVQHWLDERAIMERWTTPPHAMNDMCLSSPGNRLAIYFTKLRYEASASISFGPRWLATIGIGDPAPE